MLDGTSMLSELFERGAFESTDSAHASIAISLKRIADMMAAEKQEITGTSRITIQPLPSSAFPDMPAPSIDPKLWILFTPAEQLIVPHLVRGMQNKEIARTMGSSEGTVKTHIKNAFRKAGVASRTGFVARLYRLGEIGR